MNVIEVRSRFDGSWVRGFEVAEEGTLGDQRGLRLRRRSDGALLPTLFSPDDVRLVSDGAPQRTRRSPGPR